jgi:hypothetical protein
VTFLSRAIFAAATADTRRVPINTLIEKPKTLRWRSIAIMLRVLTERVDLNGVLTPGNIVAPESTQIIAAFQFSIRT